VEGLDWIGKINRPVSGLIGFNQVAEHLKAVGVRGATFGFMIEILLDLGQCPAIVIFVSDWPDIHHTLPASILSYSA
jgi:hypothetical protein